MPTKFNAFTATAMLVAVFYLATAFLLPLATLDSLYLPDDTYYTLSIARNIAAGYGPSTDGIIQTTGFQPLIAILLQPVFWVGLDGDAALRAAIAMSAGFGVLVVVLAGGIVRQATGSVWAGAWMLALGALSPMLFLNGLNGLETTLAGALALALIWSAANTTLASPVSRLAVLGILAGLAIWARIDTALVILVLTPVALLRLGLWRTAMVAGVAALSAAPWIIYCWQMGGSLIPESGAAVRQIVAHQFDERSRTLWQTLILSASIAPRAMFPMFGIVLSVLSLGVLFAPPIMAARKGRIDAPAILAVVALVMILFYGLLLPAFWFFHRYLYLAQIGIVVSVVVAFWPIVDMVAQRVRPAVAAILPILLMAPIYADQLTYVRLWLDADRPNIPAHGYGNMARDLLRDVPDGAVLTAMQSGALNWFAPDTIRVVNLDGVVNGAATVAIHDETLGQYMQSVGATHFADWMTNTRWMLKVSGQNVPLTQIAAHVDHAAPGKDFTLYRIDWP